MQTSINIFDSPGGGTLRVFPKPTAQWLAMQNSGGGPDLIGGSGKARIAKNIAQARNGIAKTKVDTSAETGPGTPDLPQRKTALAHLGGNEPVRYYLDGGLARKVAKSISAETQNLQRVENTAINKVSRIGMVGNWLVFVHALQNPAQMELNLFFRASHTQIRLSPA